MSKHSQLGDSNIHVPYRKVFANDGERTGDTGPYVTADLYKKAYQVDTNTEYVLTAITPTWTELANGGGGAGTWFDAAETEVLAVGKTFDRIALAANGGTGATSPFTVPAGNNLIITAHVHATGAKDGGTSRVSGDFFATLIRNNVGTLSAENFEEVDQGNGNPFGARNIDINDLPVAGSNVSLEWANSDIANNAEIIVVTNWAVLQSALTLT